MVELDEMVPWLDLLRALRALVELDRGGLSCEQQLSAVAASERMLSWLTALQHDLLAEVDRDDSWLASGWDRVPSARWRAEQVGVALGISGASAQRRMSQAVTLVEKLPAVSVALRVGAITVHHARVAAGHARVLDDEVAQTVDAAVMTDPDWRTPSQLERTFSRIVREVDATGAAQRHQAARKDRRVSLRNEPDGMCSLWASLTAEQGQAVHKTIDAHARSSAARNTPGDMRTLDQRRADALVELILREHSTPGSAPTMHGRRPDIHVTVSWSTLIGADDAPADLTGYGPVDARTARRIAFDPSSVWRRLLVDPVSGRLLDYGRTTYRPPQDLEDFVIARDVYCRFPTCDRPAVVCDLDHRLRWDDGGGTRDTNVDQLCRQHHRLKDEAGWTHERDPDSGDSYWTDPLGRTHVKPATRLPTPQPVEPPVAAELDAPPF